MSYTGPFPIIVADGGTGAATLTSHGVLIGEGTSAIQAITVGTTGQVLIGSTGANPGFGALGVNSGLTAHGVLLGEGLGAFVATSVGSTGQVLIGSTGADPAFGSLGVNSGLTAHGVLVGENNSAIVALTAGSTGQTLMGSTGADPAFTGSPSFSGSVTAGTTITATSGAITATSGNMVLTAGNLTLPTTSSTVGQITLNGTRIVHEYGANQNDFFGNGSGNFTLTVSTSVRNVALGASTLSSLTTGTDNTAMGVNAGFGITTGSGNTMVGEACLTSLTTGSSNTAIGKVVGGDGALDHLTTGSNNTAIGYSAGSAYTTSESSNILFSNTGTVSESNVIRIGTTGSGAGQQNKCFIAGIFGVTVGVSGIPVVVDNTGNLGTVVSTRRLKDNIKDMGSTSVMKLRPVTFNFKSDEAKSKHFGLIAEEVQEVMPDLVAYDDNKQPFSVHYHELPVILLNEIQKLTKRIELLEKK